MNQCELCENSNRVTSPNAEQPEANACFMARFSPEDYQPFKRSRETVRLTCGGFSHIRSAVIGYKGGGRVTLRATPAQPHIQLPGADA